jgi:hypothetical protein
VLALLPTNDKSDHESKRKNRLLVLIEEDLVENPVFEKRGDEGVRRGELHLRLQLHQLRLVHLQGVAGGRTDHLNTH